MPDYFRMLSFVEGWIRTNLYIDDQSDRQLVNEILKAEKRDLLDVWIKKVGTEKKIKAVSFVSTHHDYPVEGSEKDETLVRVNLFIYIRKTAAGQELDLNRTFARFGSKELQERVTESDKLQDLWAERKAIRGFKSNLDGLLEFSCRMNTTKEEEKQMERYPDMNHGLYKIILKDYQRQTIHWMIKEERSKGGMYRHFFTKSRFEDNSPYWFSPFFKMLWLERPPTVHGGVLCEEMGLGKTIEILSLVNSNPSPPVKSQYWAEDELTKSKAKRYPTKGNAHHCANILGGAVGHRDRKMVQEETQDAVVLWKSA
eukprot:TRINITY_DN622_c0_g2_i3.p1 TRINITY_DN622_c0_g2~~TRINITY_DN622_c0_g2_i3.p1  ORF type:complete len:321 (+),score=62.33 TRINITY_DN622_c0_g2_i3:26-964(+)